MPTSLSNLIDASSTLQRADRQDAFLRYECDQQNGACPVPALRAALAREEALLHERDVLLERQATLSREADHRFLNNLQMVSSLLSIQSRSATTPEASSALAKAADRVSTIGRIHRHLHSNDGVESVNFKCFAKELARDLAEMISASNPRVIAVEGVDLNLPTTIGIPLGFIANELITNALKYGEGPISVRLDRDALKGFALSVENAGRALPKAFDPAQSKGFGMRIVRSFVATIGGELAITRGKDDCGARFAVLFTYN